MYLMEQRKQWQRPRTTESALRQEDPAPDITPGQCAFTRHSTDYVLLLGNKGPQESARTFAVLFLQFWSPNTWGKCFSRKKTLVQVCVTTTPALYSWRFKLPLGAYRPREGSRHRARLWLTLQAGYVVLWSGAKSLSQAKWARKHEFSLL